jgi:hypothetical protein
MEIFTNLCKKFCEYPRWGGQTFLLEIQFSTQKLQAPPATTNFFGLFISCETQNTSIYGDFIQNFKICSYNEFNELSSLVAR